MCPTHHTYEGSRGAPETLLYRQNEELQKRVEQLQKSLDFEIKLNRIKDRVCQSLDEHKILPAVLEEVGVEFEIECAYIKLYPLTQNQPAITYQYDSQGNDETERIRLVEFPADLYPQPKLGEPWQVCQRFHHSTKYHGAMLACPILDYHGSVGELWLLHRPDTLFDQFELELIHQITHQCAIALRHAQTYQAALAEVATLKSKAQLKNEFLHLVLHELRTPYTTIKMAMEMLDISGQSPDKSRPESHSSNSVANSPIHYLNILQAECDRELNLINKLLEILHFDAEEQSLILETLHLQDWIPSILEPFQQRTQNHQQTLLLEIDPNLGPFISDSFCLERIITELLNNACKYTPAHGKITVIAQAETDWMNLSVKNSGVEIPECHLPYIFEKFYRIPSADQWQQGGSGLGLALVKQLTDYIAGSIQVTTGAGETCFTVKLPTNLSTSTRNDI